MTIEEAIAQLQKLPPQSKLLRADNSGGYEEVKEIRAEEIEEIQTKKKFLGVVID